MLSSSRKIAIQQVDKVVDLVLRCNCEIAFHTVLLVHRVSYRSSAAKHASHRRASLRSPVSPRTHRAVAFGWRCAYASHRRVPFVLGNVRCARLVSMHTTYHRRLVRFVPHRLPTGLQVYSAKRTKRQRSVCVMSDLVRKSVDCMMV